MITLFFLKKGEGVWDMTDKWNLLQKQTKKKAKNYYKMKKELTEKDYLLNSL